VARLMKLVRAKLKSIEEIMDVFNCCDRWFEGYADIRDMVVTVDMDTIRPVTYNCMFCGKENKGKRVDLVPPVMLIGYVRDGLIIDLYDLDEGS
jgi:hypothetical protein